MRNSWEEIDPGEVDVASVLGWRLASTSWSLVLWIVPAPGCASEAAKGEKRRARRERRAEALREMPSIAIELK